MLRKIVPYVAKETTVIGGLPLGVPLLQALKCRQSRECPMIGPKGAGLTMPYAAKGSTRQRGAGARRRAGRESDKELC